MDHEAPGGYSLENTMLPESDTVKPISLVPSPDGTNRHEDDLGNYEFQVKVTYNKLDETEVFDTLDSAKSFATDKLKDARVAKVAIKKVTPKDENGEEIDE